MPLSYPQPPCHNRWIEQSSIPFPLPNGNKYVSIRVEVPLQVCWYDCRYNLLFVQLYMCAIFLS
uniref:Uncharacterized protein n=1 Tax=Oryza meridionalis TaxID=40149 RepID=A0A0E0EK34_9ORYZ